MEVAHVMIAGLYATINRRFGEFAAENRCEESSQPTGSEFFLRLFKFAEAPPAMADDVAVGLGRRDLVFRRSPDKKTFVVIVPVSLPHIDVTTDPHPAADKHRQPGFFLDFALRGSFETLAVANAAAGRHPPFEASGIDRLEQEQLVALVQQENSRTGP